jgi:L-iditol 2-dehydrogenase
VRALRIVGPGQTRVEDVPDPHGREGETIVRVRKAAVCNTDRKLAARGVLVGRVLGHEVAGTDPDGLPVGVHPDTGCGRCEWCQRGQSNRCPDKRSVGIDLDGGLAEALVVPGDHVVPLDGVPLDVAPLLEPFACCLHAVEVTGAEAGQQAVVVGAGAMGILCMWALQARGLTVAVVQPGEVRQLLAAELGAQQVLAPEEAAALPSAPDVAVVTAPGGEALIWALEQVRVGGSVHAFAGSPGGAMVDANIIHYRHLALVGSTGSGLRDYREAVELQRRGAVDLGRLPTETVGLDGVPAAIADLPDPRVLRTLVDVGSAV